jgi:hypothetical protein
MSNTAQRTSEYLVSESPETIRELSLDEVRSVAGGARVGYSRLGNDDPPPPPPPKKHK